MTLSLIIPQSLMCTLQMDQRDNVGLHLNAPPADLQGFDHGLVHSQSSEGGRGQILEPSWKTKPQAAAAGLRGQRREKVHTKFTEVVSVLAAVLRAPVPPPPQAPQTLVQPLHAQRHVSAGDAHGRRCVQVGAGVRLAVRHEAPEHVAAHRLLAAHRDHPEEQGQEVQDGPALLAWSGGAYLAPDTCRVKSMEPS